MGHAYLRLRAGARATRLMRCAIRGGAPLFVVSLLLVACTPTGRLPATVPGARGALEPLSAFGAGAGAVTSAAPASPRGERAASASVARGDAAAAAEPSGTATGQLTAAAPELLTFPPRPDGAPSGSRFVEALLAHDEPMREEAIRRELVRGNVPEALRHLARVGFEGVTRSGRRAAVTLWVTPDYLAVGDDDDNVRVPMNAVTAQEVADTLGFMLPTAKVVDAIYAGAKVKLAPRTLTPNGWMVRTEAFVFHDALVDAQIAGLANKEPTALVAGHKKDVVLSNRLEARAHRLALYGWHDTEGRPIQSLCTAHGDWYSDYSHGVRLVARTMQIDGAPRSVAEVLEDPELAPLLSDEGPLAHTRYQTDRGVAMARWWPRLRDGDEKPPAVVARAAQPEGGAARKVPAPIGTARPASKSRGAARRVAGSGVGVSGGGDSVGRVTGGRTPHAWP
jgi:hypothetical protein